MNAATALVAALAVIGAPMPPPERGVGLGLFASTPTYDYGQLIEELAATGATHVCLVWVWWQQNVGATEIRRVDGWTATDAQVTGAITAARRLGLHVTAFPIVRLIDGGATDWRGKIAPTDESRWWRSYDSYILHSAALAKRAGAQRLSVGSELVSREGMRGRWLELIDRVRLSAPELELMYSANWDHYGPVSFWDAVDVVGLTGYFELTRSLDPSRAELVQAWLPIRRALGAWSAEIGRPLVISEIGYPSLDGASAWPWDETRKAPVDLEEQRIAYEAFVRAWDGVSFLRGAYWWNWFGWGGPKDTGYTPRGKPAARVIERWFAAPAPGEADAPK